MAFKACHLLVAVNKIEYKATNWDVNLLLNLLLLIKESKSLYISPTG